MINSIIRYFDLQSEHRDRGALGQAGGKPRHAPVFPQYLAVCFGIVVDPYLREYLASEVFNATWSDLGLRTLFSMIIAIAILPAVYKRSFDPERPLSVQLATLFVSGLGWQSLFASAVKLGGA